MTLTNGVSGKSALTLLFHAVVLFLPYTSLAETPIASLTCKKNPDCPAGYYCVYANDNCGEDGVLGVCQEIPKEDREVACLTVLVCGCDGKIYSTPCAAAEAGIAYRSSSAHPSCGS